VGLFTDLMELEYHRMVIALSNERTRLLRLGGAGVSLYCPPIQTEDYHKPIDKAINLKRFVNKSVKVNYKKKAKKSKGQ